MLFVIENRTFCSLPRDLTIPLLLVTYTRQVDKWCGLNSFVERLFIPLRNVAGDSDVRAFVKDDC